SLRPSIRDLLDGGAGRKTLCARHGAAATHLNCSESLSRTPRGSLTSSDSLVVFPTVARSTCKSFDSVASSSGIGEARASELRVVVAHAIDRAWSGALRCKAPCLPVTSEGAVPRRPSEAAGTLPPGRRRARPNRPPLPAGETPRRRSRPPRAAGAASAAGP